MKILVLRNNLTYSIDGFEQSIAFFKSRLSFPIELTFKDINIPTSVTVYKTVKGFNAQTGKPSDIKYLGLTESVQNQLKTLVKDGEYQIVMFAWDLDTAPQSGDSVVTSWCMSQPLYPNTEYIQLAINKYLNTNGSNWKRITHEIMHALCYMVNRKGANIIDPMDSWKTPNDFVENDNPESPTGNYSEAFRRLNPHLKLLTPTMPLQGSTSPVNDSSLQKAVILALSNFGIKEVKKGENPTILQFYKDVGHSWVKEDEVAWCAAFVGACLERSGIKSTKALNARSYLKWGKETKTPKTGDIAVFKRGLNPAEGHVAFFIREEGDKVIVLGGNQSDSVSVQGFPKTSLLGYRTQ